MECKPRKTREIKCSYAGHAKKKLAQLPEQDQPTTIKFGLQIYLYKCTSEASCNTKTEAQNDLSV